GNLADRDFLAGYGEASPAAFELGIVTRERKAECDRLGEDAVAAPDHWDERCFACAVRKSREKLVAPLAQKVGRIAKQQCERCVEYVTGGHPTVQPACISPHELLNMGKESNHIMLRRSLDLLNALTVEHGPLSTDPCCR